MAKFTIIGEVFDPKVVTNLLELEPDKFWLTGEPIEGKPSTRKFTLWSISTGYEESFDINDQLSKIVEALNGKIGVLSNLKRKYNVNYFFVLVVKVECDQTPAIHFDKQFIAFANEIEAEINIDLYTSST